MEATVYDDNLSGTPCVYSILLTEVGTEGPKLIENYSRNFWVQRSVVLFYLDGVGSRVVVPFS